MSENQFQQEMNAFIWIGAGALAYYLYKRGSTIASLNFVVQKVDFDVSNALLPVANVTVQVQNPTNGTLTLQSLSGNFYFNDKLGGSVSDFTPAIVGPNSATSIVLRLQSNDAQLISALLTFLNSRQGFTISVKAVANVSGIPIPVNLNFTPAL